MTDQPDLFNNQPEDNQTASPQAPSTDDPSAQPATQQDDVAAPEQAPLPQDFETPAADPVDTEGSLHVEHQVTDTGVDQAERYDQGLSDAAVDNPAEGLAIETKTEEDDVLAPSDSSEAIETQQSEEPPTDQTI